MYCKLNPSDRIKSWLARRDYSQYELLARISKTFPDLDDIELLIESLHNENYLNDERFALSRARHRSSQGYGPYRLTSELREHRIHSDVVQLAIESVDWKRSWQLRVRKSTSKDKLASLAMRTGFPVSYAKEDISEI